MPLNLVNIRLDGRIPPTVTNRATARISWNWDDSSAGEPGTVMLHGASTREKLESGDLDVWDVAAVEPGTTAITVPHPAVGRVHWRLVNADTVGSHPTHVQVTRQHTLWKPSWITHPDWAEQETDSGARWFASEIVFEPTRDDAIEMDFATPAVAWVSVNGDPIKERLAPGYAQYREEIPAVTIDLTHHLKPGTNPIVVELAPGMGWVTKDDNRYSKLTNHAAPLRLSARIHHHHRDGTSTISTPHWRTGRAAATATHWYGGEDHDLTLDRAEADAVYAASVEDNRPVWWPEHPPTEITETLAPVKATQTGAGSTVIDFGTNIAGIPRLRTENTPPLHLVISPGELLDESGHVTQWSTGSPIFHRVSTGAGPIDWHPRYSFNGFRYIEVEGALTGTYQWSAEVLRVANRSVGSFRSSDPFLNKLHQLVDRAVQGNMHSVFTDCPHREKLGWLEQLHLCFGALSRNYDVEAHLRDSLHHIRTAQLDSGAVPNIAPEFIDFSGHEFRGDQNAFREDPNWGGALIRTTWNHYRCYGDPRVLEENIAAIGNYLAYLETRRSDGLLDFGLGDWVGLGHHTPRELVASYGYAGILQDAARVYSHLGDHPRSLQLAASKEELVETLVGRYPIHPESTQAEIALVADLHPHPAMTWLHDLEQRIARDRRLTVGEIALPALVRLFTAHGADDRLRALISREDVPGYGHQVASGATALTETWTMTGGDEGEGSQNHFMLGMIDDWLHETIAGLQQAPEDIGWKDVIVQPRMLNGVRSAETRYQSPQGTYAIKWNNSDGFIAIDIPAGGAASLLLPENWTAPARLGPGQHIFRRNR